MASLMWFAGGIFVGGMGMFAVMLSVIMSREWERMQKETREGKP